MLYNRGVNFDNTGMTVELGDLIKAGVNIWDFDYPSYYTGAEKKAFEQKVIDHYRFRQIGQETPARFMHYFRTRVREIMPYYIQLYKSVELLEAQDDPLESYHLEETYTRDAETTGKSDSTGRFSDTPQGKVENIDDYLTEATRNDATNEGSSKETYSLTRRGNIGVQPLGYELNELRKAFINVDEQVIAELNDLFLKVY